MIHRNLFDTYKSTLLRLVSISFIFIINIVITRIISVEERAIYGIAYNNAFLLSQVFNLGFNNAGLHLVSQSKENMGRYVFSSLLITVISTITYVFFLIIFKKIDLLSLFSVSMSVFMLLALFLVNGYIGLQKINHYNIFEIAKNIFLIFILIFFSDFFEKKINFVIYVYTIVNFIFYAVLTYSLIKGTHSSIKEGLKLIKNYFKISLKSYISCLLSSFLTWLVIFSLEMSYKSGHISLEILGYYILAFNHISYAILVFSTIALIETPKIMNAGTIKERLRKTYVLSLQNLIILIIGIAIFYAFLPDLFALIYGEKQRMAGTIFKTMLAPIFILVALSCFAPLMLYLKMPRVTIFAPLLGILCFFLSIFMRGLGDPEAVIDAYTIALFAWLVLYFKTIYEQRSLKNKEGIQECQQQQ